VYNKYLGVRIYRYKEVGVHGGCDEWCRKTIGPFVYTSGTMAQISAAFRRTDPSSSLRAVSPPQPSAVQKQQKTIIRRTQQMRNRFRELLCIQSVLSLSHTHTRTNVTQHTPAFAIPSITIYSLSFSLTHPHTISPSLVRELTVGVFI